MNGLKVFRLLVITGIIFGWLSLKDSSAYWFETENITAGNFTFESGSTKEFFLEIPDSPYFILKGINGLVIIDKTTFRVRDSLVSDHNYDNCVVLPDQNSGWNIYYTLDQTFRLIRINTSGESGREEILPIAYSGSSILSAGAPKRGEAWFFSSKIYRIESAAGKWTEFDYDQNWDMDQKSLKIFQTEDQNRFFLRSFGNTKNAYQMEFFDLETGNMKLMQEPEANFFSLVRDVKEWKGHDDKYLLLRKESLWIYDSADGTIVSYIDGFETGSNKIMQDEEGKFLYLFGTSSSGTLGTTFYIVDLQAKTIGEHQIILEEGWGLTDLSTTLDRKRHRIISIIRKNTAYVWINKPVIIDLIDISAQYITGVESRNINYIIYLEDENKLVGVGQNSPFIIQMDLAAGGNKLSIPLGCRAYKWSTLKGASKPSVLNNGLGTEFCQLLPVDRRVFHDAGLRIDRVAQFPDNSGAIIRSDDNYREYFFDGDYGVDIVPPQNIFFFYPDPNRNQIIGVDNVGTSVQFLRPNANFRMWLPPEEDGITKGGSHLFDPDNEAFWMIYNNRDVGKLAFYQISTQSYQVIETFVLSGLDYIPSFLDFTIDPLQRYFYFIACDENDTIRELLILDIENRKILKKITLQENVKNPFTSTRVIPGIIPVPEKDKIFLWDHYCAWSIDTNSFDVVYGNVVDNPLNFGADSTKNVLGFVDDKSENVVVVDNSIQYGSTEDSHKHVLEIKLDTGEILQKIRIPDDVSGEPFFPADKNEIFFLSPNGARLYTLLLSPAWSEPATISPSTNYVQLGSGDNARFSVSIKNPIDFSQNATAYIWLYAPDGTMLFFSPTGLTFDIAGIPLELPTNCDVTGDILSFTMPAGVPEGFYNFNAVFINEKGDRGPIGTWNFYVRD